jgi:intracellular sulfur oxidation DsrE/DsrF family protein
MNKTKLPLLFTLLFSLLFVQAYAVEGFSDGPLIKGFGKHVKVTQTHPVAENAEFKVVFDVSKQADEGRLNRSFGSLARFLNMHVANGVKPENIHLALVVHGKAGFDLLNDETYRAKFKQANMNIALLNELSKNNTQIFICGQSAAYYGIKATDLNPNVAMSLSAMTANALLQQQGYTLNPF